jgi:hypothetical protein
MVQQGRIVKIAYRRHTTELSLVFVLVGMMFLVPVMTENALGYIGASARISYLHVFPTTVRGHMDVGYFASGPTFIRGSYPTDSIIWETRGHGLFGGNEKGYVQADTPTGLLTFDFSNPLTGLNTCSVVAPIFTTHTCTITQGHIARATYHVSIGVSNGGNSGNANGGDDNSGGDNSGDAP